MAKNGWTLFQELLEQGIALGLVAASDDYFGDTQPFDDTAEAEAVTAEYRLESDLDTRRIRPIRFTDCRLDF